jgi:hypothetical protein
MRYLVSGSTRSLARLGPLHPARLGFLLTPANRSSVAAILALGLPWAGDNGAYSGLDEAAFRRMLRRITGVPGCLFVAAPDVVADAGATLAQFPRWAALIRSCGQPVALVGQDGAEDLPIPWESFDCWFVGGSTRWKLSQASADLCREAKRRGKHAHVGRVNSLRRLRAALDMGADTVDGSSASMWGDKYIAKYPRWIDALCAQPTLYPEEVIS